MRGMACCMGKVRRGSKAAGVEGCFLISIWFLRFDRAISHLYATLLRLHKKELSTKYL